MERFITNVLTLMPVFNAAFIILVILTAVIAVAKLSLFAPVPKAAYPLAKGLFITAPLMMLVYYMILRPYSLELDGMTGTPGTPAYDAYIKIWIFLIVIEIILLLLAKILRGVFFFSSHYARITGFKFNQVFSDQVLYGQYLTSLMFELIYGRTALYMYNALVRKPDNSYAEAQMVVISPAGVFVVDTLPYDGVLQGRTTDTRWVLQTELSAANIPNPIKHNEDNLNAVYYAVASSQKYDQPLAQRLELADSFYNVVLTEEKAYLNVSGVMPREAYCMRRTGFEKQLRRRVWKKRVRFSFDKREKFYEVLRPAQEYSSDFKYSAHRENDRRYKRSEYQKPFQFYVTGISGATGFEPLVLTRFNGCYWEKYLVGDGPCMWVIAPEVPLFTAEKNAMSLETGIDEADALISKLNAGEDALKTWRGKDAGSSTASSVNAADSPVSEEAQYKKAAENGDADAQFEYGCICINNSNHNEAFGWMKKAAAQNHTSAIFRLGMMYEDGVGTRKNAVQAYHAFRKASNEGFVPAQLRLGRLLESGRVKAEGETAAHWYKMAADNGDEEAQTWLAEHETENSAS